LQPANRESYRQRGRIEVGYFADLVLFDTDTITERASFAEPAQISAGIASVWVNGVIAWRKQAPSSQRNGRFLTH
jgi:N-acyl-D-amino-acid deacylase